MLSATIELIEDMGHDLAVFKMYEWVFKPGCQMEDLLVDTLVDVIVFWARTIRFLRRHPLVNLAQVAWPNVRKEFAETMARIRRRIRQVKENAEALSLREATHQNQRTTNMESNEADSHGMVLVLRQVMPVQCSNIPFPRNPHFYGREEELGKIRSCLDHDLSHPKYSALSIVGMGGVGKSQIALSYAYEQLEKGVQAVFWINSESVFTISQGFTEIAGLLGLEGAIANGGHDQNLYLVKQWLQKTTHTWLIIFDNVDNGADLRGCWPVTVRGSILITTRNDSVALETATKSTKIPLFKPSEGSTIILNVVQREAYSQSERAAAVTLAEKLDGLALALNLMATQIYLKQMTVADFLNYYEANSERLSKTPRAGTRNRYYSHGLDTAFQTAFDSLDELSVVVFGVACFVAPDAIPDQLFKPDSDTPIGKEEPWNDPFSIDESIETLLSTSLMMKDPITQQYRVHRLVQKEFRDWLGSERRKSAFINSSKLLFEAFPKSVTCHASVLGERFKRYSYVNLDSISLESFTGLIANATWYLFETSSNAQCFELLNIGFAACKGEENLLCATLCNTAGCCLREQGRTIEAYPYFYRSEAIRKRLLPPDHPDIANIYNNIAGALLTDYRTDESIVLYEAARDIDLKSSWEERKTIIFLRYLNLGIAYTYKTRYEDAKIALDESEAYIVAAFGHDTHYEAIYWSYSSYLYWAQAKYEESRAYAERALQNFISEQEFHPTTIGSHYRIACVDMREEGTRTASVERLRRALEICAIVEPAKGGHTARVSRKLAEVLFMSDETLEEAKELKKAAENLRKTIQGRRFSTYPDEDHTYDILIPHYFR